MTIKTIPAQQRHFSDYGWLKTYWLFSFSDYYDPDNIQLGALRVFNDDVVAPMRGFPTHPHKEMEIITIVLDGTMTHEDSMGNRTTIHAGDVQRMSAGTGITHSEYNLGEKPTHFYQIWIYPDKLGLKPSYEQKQFSPEIWKNKLCALASGQGKPNTVIFHTDATIYRASLEAGKTLDFHPSKSRSIFIYLICGELAMNDTILNTNDQARIECAEPLSFKARNNSELILIDVPFCKD
ncbi:MAG: pirin family protein [Candidatus Brocadiae bacterium]|nr:pirin family protein [Candidatus Brocadiia bacterium]